MTNVPVLYRECGLLLRIRDDEKNKGWVAIMDEQIQSVECANSLVIHRNERFIGFEEFNQYCDMADYRRFSR